MLWDSLNQRDTKYLSQSENRVGIYYSTRLSQKIGLVDTKTVNHSEDVQFVQKEI